MRRKVRPDEKMGQFQSQLAQGTLICVGCTWPQSLGSRKFFLLSFAFPFPLLLGEAAQAALIVRASTPSELPMAMIKHLSLVTQALTKWRGHPSSNTGTQLLSQGHLCRVVPW